jgi:hypothetical protein
MFQYTKNRVKKSTSFHGKMSMWMQKMILKKSKENLYIIFIFQMNMVMNAIIYNHKNNNTPKYMKLSLKEIF